MKNNPALVRVMYIILIPVVLLIVLLNSGWLQRILPAASLHGENCSVVQFNFFYFENYNGFLEENAEKLDQLGYDPSVSAARQTDADGRTWRQVFLAEAEELMVETAYYCDQAEAAGYEFSAEELAPVERKLEEQRAEQETQNIKGNNYYLAYYGSGMTEERFTAEYTRLIKAQAYRTYLISTMEPQQAEMDAWLAEHSVAEGRTVDLKVITLSAIRDRETDRVGAPELAALEQKIQRLEERCLAGESLDDLQQAFSDNGLGDSAGMLTSAAEGELPTVLAQWCIAEQDSRTVGDRITCVDEAEGRAYLAEITGFGGVASEQEAARALNEAALTQELDEQTEYQVKEYSFSMNLVGA